jgi:nitronate monooxygenase
MALATQFTELVGCRVPVQQAPMGSVSTHSLAVAVADAGGVGSITALGLSAAKLGKVLAVMAAQTTGVLAVNFLTEDIDREAVEVAAARMRIIDFFWADPDPELVELAHRNGALAWARAPAGRDRCRPRRSHAHVYGRVCCRRPRY